MRDYKQLLQEGPENGIWIKQVGDAEAMDKFYVMVQGPLGPYQGALFFFSLEPWTSYNMPADGRK